VLEKAVKSKGWKKASVGKIKRNISSKSGTILGEIEKSSPLYSQVHFPMMHEEFRSSGLDISHANITNNMGNEAAQNSSLFQVDQTATPHASIILDALNNA